MTATCNIPRRICFLLLSCVTLLISSEVSRLEIMMVSAERAMVQRHDRALLSTSDQLSASLEERVAPVAVEEEAGLLSRFMSHFKPSYLWQKLASSWIMRFFKPHIYLRYAANKEAAGEKLLKKVNADQAVDFFNSKEFQKWSKYFVDAFPDNPDEAARLMVSTLATYRIKKLVDSIPTTKVVGGKLAFGEPFGVALTKYVAEAEKDAKLKPFADLLEKSLVNLINELKANEGTKSIGDRLERDFREFRFSNDKEKLVNVDTQQPVSKLSSQHEVISKPVIPLTPALVNQEEKAFELLKDVQLDKVKTDIFNSTEFTTWSKQIAETFPAELDEGAGLMLTTLVRHDMEKVIDSIPTTKVVDDKLAFGDHFEVALKNYIANAKHDADLKPFADRLEDSLLRLSTRLKADEGSKSIGDRIENEIFNGWFSNNDNLVDVLNRPILQDWYFRKPLTPKNTRASDLYHKIEQLGISEQKIGEAHFEANGHAVQITEELVDYKLNELMEKVNVMDAVMADELGTIIAWMSTAKKLRADPVNSILPRLRKVFKDGDVLELCESAFPREVMNKIQEKIVKSYSRSRSIDFLENLSQKEFSWKNIRSRAWMDYMKINYGDNANEEMVSFLTSKNPKIIPSLIEEGETSADASVLSLTNALKMSRKPVAEELLPKEN
ncbi:hypothetical protein Plhal703r1_c37g0133251 [Plasmopara halstedii]